MSFLKLGEALEITSSDIVPIDSINLSDSEVNDRFSKYASTLKRIAPKADDFLYFSAVMMHSAEASLLNLDGTQKLDIRGTPVSSYWQKKGESLKWICSDPSIKPYKNVNGDIFPEQELVKAYQKWIGKPLCIDHKSSSVDAIRGLIVDTYYDRKLKRVIALCALDKVNYPDLARKVASGYATCVSMGTAVGKAICSDCGTVARTAEDFCIHMRTKSCYGEINLDLQPIELSIVVNGADPQAKIKHIIAAADSLNKYVDSKQIELNSVSSTKDIESIESELKDLTEKVAKLKEDLSDITTNSSSNIPQEGLTDSPYGQPLTPYIEESQMEPVSSGIAPISFASNDGVALKLLNNINTNIEKLASKLDMIKESNQNIKVSDKENINSVNTASEKKMTIKKESYFQGGGEGNEPTPGQPKYEKDPMNEDLRLHGDKHMLGQHNTDTGPVDGMHPGTDSSGMSDEKRKEMLARAETEQRSVRRAEALEKAKSSLLTHKEAYYQGAGKESDPTPGKVKYPADPMNEKARETADKQMVGQKPFPGVGDIEGPLGGKEEVAQKKLLQRASLKLRFVKAANVDGTENLGDSAWQVFSNDKLVLTASVDELSGGKTETLYDLIATKEYGQKMLEKIKSLGFEKAITLYKKAQEMPAAPAPSAPEAAPMAEPASADMPDMNKDGDPKVLAMDLAEQARDVSSDLVEAVKALTGEQSEVNSVEEMPKTASVETLALYKMRKELNSALISGMKKAASELKEHENELKLISNILDKGAVNDSNESYVNDLVNDAIVDAKSSLADAFKLMGAFVKYARGTEALVKRAEAEAKLNKTASDAEGDTMGANDQNDLDLDALLSDLDSESVLDKDIDGLELASDDDVTYSDDEEVHMTDMPVDDESMASDGTVVELPAGASVPVGAKAVTASFDLTTKEGRASYRAKLASEADFSDMIDEAHPKGGFTTELDTKPSGDLAKVETGEEAHAKFMDVAKAPPKVRKEAEQIQKLVSEGKLAAEDVDALVAHGADSEAVKYWKQFYGEAGKEGSQFASELVKEHAKAKFDEELNAHKVKISRAYSLANEMVRRGICAEDDSAITAQVEEIMKWNDEGYDSMKKLVAKQGVKKTASSLPRVGVIGSGDVSSDSSSGEVNLYDDLVRAFSTKKH